MIRTISRLRRFIEFLGVQGTLAYLFAENRRLLPLYSQFHHQQPWTYHLFAKDLPYALLCRANTSDRAVFWQIFVERAYETSRPDHPPQVIIDCGAYVGYSTAYFLSRYPQSTVIALEPDPENFQILQQNTAPFGSRAVLLNQAVWSEESRLRLIDQGAKWTTRVENIQAGEIPEEYRLVDGISLEYLLKRYCLSHIDILKVDIEGAERQVFAKNDQSWLDKVDVILIELHGQEARRLFYQALGNLPFTITPSGGVVLAQRQRSS